MSPLGDVFYMFNVKITSLINNYCPRMRALMDIISKPTVLHCELTFCVTDGYINTYFSKIIN
jgi:hypothetical protein